MSEDSQLAKVDFLEMQLDPISLSKEELLIAKDLLDIYRVGDEDEYYYSELNINLTQNTYAIYYIFYDYLLMKAIGCNTTLIDNNIQYISTAAINAMKNEEISALDLISAICLEKMCTGEYDSELFSYFNNLYFCQEEGLYKENAGDSVESRVAFTVDICSMMNISGIQYNDNIKLSIENYFENKEFGEPDDIMSIYTAGGDALYAMVVVENQLQISSEIQEWYNEWKEMYDITNVESWEDVLEIECIFRPVANAMMDLQSYDAVGKFISDEDNISRLIEDYEERLAYDLVKNYILDLSQKGKEILTEKLDDVVKEHLNSIKRISMRSTFYGIRLYSSVHNTAAIPAEVISSIDCYYTELISNYLNNDSPDMLAQVVNDTYYYLMIDFQINEGQFSGKLYKYVRQILNKARGTVSSISNLDILMELCMITSQLDMKFCKDDRNVIKEIYETFCDYEEIMSSYYIVDLYIIGEIMGYDVLSDSLMKGYVYNLEESGCYRDYLQEGGRISLEATYKIYALVSCTECLGNIYDEKNMLKETLKTNFMNEEGTYTIYPDMGESKLYMLYWGICLSNL